jgi:hypothetical protein
LKCDAFIAVENISSGDIFFVPVFEKSKVYHLLLKHKYKNSNNITTNNLYKCSQKVLHKESDGMH